MFPWVYRGEGNQHIVVSNEKKRIVYRMFKRIRNGQKKQKVDYDLLRNKLERCLEFTSNIMLPLISSDYLHCGCLVEIPESTASMIKSCLVNRPVYREDKELDITCPYALQMPDYCYVNQTEKSVQSCGTSQLNTKPVYTVEIKPKWGFLPAGKTISKSREIKYSVCRFCMHQHLKIAKGKWNLHSHYCPLDLFSGDVARMKHALRMLFNVPQNNLRLFKNGKVIWNDVLQEKCGSPDLLFLNEFANSGTEDIISVRSQFDDFLDLLVKTLLHRFSEECHAVIAYPYRCTDHNVPLQECRPQVACDTRCTALIAHNDSLHTNGVSTSVPSCRSLMHIGFVSTKKAGEEFCKHQSNSHSNDSASLINTYGCGCYSSHAVISDEINNRSENGLAANEVDQRSGELCNGNKILIYPETCKESTYTERDHEKTETKTSLPNGCVLYQVLRAQKLDTLDTEGIMPLYKLVKTNMEQKLNEDSSNLDPYNFCGPYHANWWSPSIDSKSSDDEKLNYAIYKIKEYLVSRSAKDCSIMISIQQCSPSQDTGRDANTTDSSAAANHSKESVLPERRRPDDKDVLDPTSSIRNDLPNKTGSSCCGDGEPAPDDSPPQSGQTFPAEFLVQDQRGTNYKAVVAVIDLDPKRFDKIPQYMVEDEEIVNCYLDYLNRCTENLDKQ